MKRGMLLVACFLVALYSATFSSMAFARERMEVNGDGHVRFIVEEEWTVATPEQYKACENIGTEVPINVKEGGKEFACHVLCMIISMLIMAWNVVIRFKKMWAHKTSPHSPSLSSFFATFAAIVALDTPLTLCSSLLAAFISIFINLCVGIDQYKKIYFYLVILFFSAAAMSLILSLVF